VDAVRYAHPEIEGLDRDAILAIQRRKLKALGDRLQGSPDWVRHFGNANMSPRDLGDLDALSSVPTLDKADLRKLYPFPMLTTELARVRRFVATSGTSGMPVMFGLTERDLNQLIPYQMCRILRAAESPACNANG